MTSPGGVMGMKPKIAAILVIGLLTMSIVGTGIAAVSQAVSEQPEPVSYTHLTLPTTPYV